MDSVRVLLSGLSRRYFRLYFVLSFLGGVRGSCSNSLFFNNLAQTGRTAKKKRKFGSIYVHVNKRDAEGANSFVLNILTGTLYRAVRCISSTPAVCRLPVLFAFPGYPLKPTFTRRSLYTHHALTVESSPHRPPVAANAVSIGHTFCRDLADW
jgi:hypothetical protein